MRLIFIFLILLTAMISKAEFLIGYNQAWFGNHYGRSLTSNFDEARVQQVFQGIRANGGSIVRLWLFEANQGFILDENMQITGVKPELVENLKTTLRIARQNDLKVYLTFMEGNFMPSEPGNLRNFFYNVLNEKYGQGEALRTKVFDPVLDAIAPFKRVIFAADLMNEIQAPIFRGYWSDSFEGPRTWMRTTAAFIKSRLPWLKLSSSAGWDFAAININAGLYTGLGLDFYDLHVYADNGLTPYQLTVCKKAALDNMPILLGEFGQRTKVQDDALQKNAVEKILASARGSCFFGALAWRYDAAEKWWNFENADGSMRPAAEIMKAYANQIPAM